MKQQPPRHAIYPPPPLYFPPPPSNVEQLAGGIMSAVRIFLLFSILAPIALIWAIHDPNSAAEKAAAQRDAQRLENQRINRGIVDPH